MPREPIQIPTFSAKMQQALNEKDASFIFSKPGMPTAVFKDAAGADPAEISLYGEIGDPFSGADATTFGRFMRANKGKPINVRINSPGGHVYDGITIHNALVQHDAKVTTIIEGMAGSAASIIAMAGNPVQIYDNANVFVHRASVVAIGNTDVMDEARQWLDKIDEGIVNTYKAKTGLPRDKIKAHMRGKSDGTIFTAKEAKGAGYVDEIVPLGNGAKASASTELRTTAERELASLEFQRAERIKARREMFAPAE